jgi:hypothetical protein
MNRLQKKWVALRQSRLIHVFLVVAAATLCGRLLCDALMARTVDDSIATPAPTADTPVTASASVPPVKFTASNGAYPLENNETWLAIKRNLLVMAVGGEPGEDLLLTIPSATIAEGRGITREDYLQVMKAFYQIPSFRRSAVDSKAVLDYIHEVPTLELFNQGGLTTEYYQQIILAYVNKQTEILHSVERVVAEGEFIITGDKSVWHVTPAFRFQASQLPIMSLTTVFGSGGDYEMETTQGYIRVVYLGKEAP